MPVKPLAHIGTTSSGRTRSGTGCRYSAGICFYSAHTRIKEETLLYCQTYLESIRKWERHPDEHETLEEVGRERHHEHVRTHEPHLHRRRRHRRDKHASTTVWSTPCN